MNKGIPCLDSEPSLFIMLLISVDFGLQRPTHYSEEVKQPLFFISNNLLLLLFDNG